MTLIKIVHFRLEHAESAAIFERTVNAAVTEMQEQGCAIGEVRTQYAPMSGISAASLTATITYDTVDKAHIENRAKEKIAAAIEILERPVERIAIPPDAPWMQAEPLSDWFMEVDGQRKEAIGKLREI
jgi:hypothetical protein